MRVLLDEQVTGRLRRELPGHEVVTVGELGWSGKKNGELLALADASFDVFVTMDRNIPYQPNLQRLRRLSLVILVVLNTNIRTLRPLLPTLRAAIANARPGSAVEVRLPITDSG